MDYQTFASSVIYYHYSLFIRYHAQIEERAESAKFIATISRISGTPMEDLREMLAERYEEDKDKVNEFIEAVEQANQEAKERRKRLKDTVKDVQ